MSSDRIDTIEEMVRRSGAFGALGLAVPMSNSRYMATESQLTISPWNFCARDNDSAVFPLAVGPRITTNKRIRGRGSTDSGATFSAGSNGSHASSGPE